MPELPAKADSSALSLSQGPILIGLYIHLLCMGQTVLPMASTHRISPAALLPRDVLDGQDNHLRCPVWLWTFSRHHCRSQYVIHL